MKLLSIQEAANILGVSTKTLRRWEKKGILVPNRTSGNQRRYTQGHIDNFRFPSQSPGKFSIKEVANTLGVSTKTLRRWEKKGILVPNRTSGNQRRYTQGHIDNFRKQSGYETPASLIRHPVSQAERDGYGESIVGVPVRLLSEGVTGREKNLDQYGNAQYWTEELVKSILVFKKLAVFAVFIMLFVAVAGVAAATLKSANLLNIASIPKILSVLGVNKNNSAEPQISEVLRGKAVLGAGTTAGNLVFGVNVQSEFADSAQFLNTIKVAGVATLSGGVITENADIDAGTGKLTASNVLYGAIGGDGITVGPGQTPTITNTGVLSLTAGSGISVGTGSKPTISNTGVLSLGGSTGALTLTAGTGISISGLTITNSDTGTAQNIFKTVAVTGSTSIAASSNTDTLTFTAGTGISLSSDSTNKKITIAGSATGADFQENAGALSPINITDDLLLGGISTSTAKFAFINNAGGTPTASISAVSAAIGSRTGLVLGADSTIQSLLNATLTLGGNTTGNIVLSPLNGNGDVKVQGTTTLGNITYTWPTGGQSSGLALTTNGSGTLSWQDLGTSVSNFWRLANGAVYTANSTVDLLIGTSDGSTASAKFAVLNVNSGTPTASISGNVTLNSAGVIQTTKNQTLTVGGNSTGNIILSPNNGTGFLTFNSDRFNDITGDGLTISSNALSVDLLSASDSAGTASNRSGLELRPGTGGRNQLTLLQGCSNGELLKWDEPNGIWTCSNDIGGQSSAVIAVQEGTGTPITGIDTLRFTASDFDVSSSLNTGIISFDSSLARWDKINGTAALGNSTLDLLIGGTTSTSAKFAVLNINSGTPTASISANSGNNAAFLTGLGVLGTTNRQTLSLGNASTGDINLVIGGSNNLRINGTAGSTVTSGSCVTTTNGIVTGSISCDLGNANWFSSLGALYPGNSTLDLLIGGQTTSSAKFAVLNINSGTPTASVSATATGTGLVLGGDGTIQSLRKANLTLGGSTTGGINFTPGNIQTMFLSSIGRVGIGTVTNPNGLLTISGDAGNNASLIVNNSTSNGDLFTASASGTTRFRVANTGELIFADNGSSFFGTLDLTTLTANRTYTFPNGTGTVCVSGDTCATSGTVGYWNQSTLGTLFPGNSTVDLLVGGTTTTSAKFAVLNVNSGTPTASLSATTTGLVLSGGGSIQSLQNGTITIGGDTTGEIILKQSNLNLLSAPGGAGTGNIFVGLQAGNSNTTGTKNITLGYKALFSNTTGAQNTALGYGALLANTTGVNNTALGTRTLEDNITGGSNTALGTLALRSNITGDNNTALGNRALDFNTTGAQNTALGDRALLVNTSGDNNTALGDNALAGNQSGSNNTAVGSPALSSNTTGSNNTAIGYQADVTAANLTNATAIGANSSVGQSNALVLGGTGANAVNVGIGTTSPLTTLDVVGSASLSANLSLGVAATHTFNILDNGTLNFRRSPGGNAGLATALFIQNNSNVGIGTTAPISLLHVSGNAGNNATLILNNTGASTSDLFTASASGATKFTISNGGDVTIGDINDAAGTSRGIVMNTHDEPDNQWLGISGGGAYNNGARGAFVNLYGNEVPGNLGGNLVLSAGQAKVGNGGISFNTDPTTGNTNGSITRMTITNEGLVGIGATSPLSTLDVRPNLTNGGTISIASISGKTSFAGLLVDNTGVGDLFTASKSGAIKFVILNNGNLQFAGTTNFLTTLASAATAARTITFPDATGTICVSGSACGAGGATGAIGFWSQSSLGTLYPDSSTVDLLVGTSTGASASAKFAVLNINSGTPTASVSAGTAGAAYLNATGTLQTTANQTLTLGGNTTGNIILPFNAATKVGIGTALPLAGLDIRGMGPNFGTTAIASISGKTSFAGLLVDNTGVGDLFTASKSGAIKFVILNNGNLQFAGTTNFLTTLASAATAARTITFPDATGTICVSGSACGAGGATGAIGFWSQSSLGTLYPDSSTVDLLVGTSTGASASAKFAVLNINSGTPTASVSAAGAAIGSRTGLVLGADSTIQSLQKANLTLGGSTTGGINFTPGNIQTMFLSSLGRIGVGTVTNPKGLLDIIGNAGQNAALIINQTGTNTNDYLFTASSSGITKFVINNIGRIGIGTTTSPIGLMQITGDAGNNATLILNNTGATTSDLFTASASGTTKFTIQNDGDFQFAGSTSVLTTLTSAATVARTITFPDATGTICVSGNTCAAPASGTVGYWNQSTLGTLYPDSSTVDLLVGTSTGASASAKFAVLNISSGTPTASVSAGTAGAAYLTATGTLQTTVMQSLVLGGSTTGDISFKPGNIGLLYISGKTGTIGLGNGAFASNNKGLVNIIGDAGRNAALIINQTGTNANDYLFTASSSGITKFVINNIGRVGIGTTTSPIGLMQITGDAGNNATLMLNNTGATTSDLFTASASGTTKLLITNEGFIGILDGTSSTAIGYQALGSNTTGTSNTALGYQALFTNTTGSSNTAVGYQALYSNATNFFAAGSNNTAVGYQALYSNATNFLTAGSNNTAVGYQALFSNTTGSSNTAVGYQALRSNTTSIENTAVGNQALFTNTTGSSNTALGSQALSANTTGGSNTAVGNQALFTNTTGSSNTAVGSAALRSNTTSIENTALGSQALSANTTGGSNTAVGNQALSLNTTGGSNTALGSQALELSTASNNTAVGHKAGRGVTEEGGSVFIGFNAGNAETLGAKLYIATASATALIYGDFKQGQVGINTLLPGGTLDVQGGKWGGNAALIVNQTGASTNDIFTASASGTTRFVINNNGNVGIGTTTPNASLSLGTGVVDNKLYLYDGGGDKYGFGIRSSQFMIYSGVLGASTGGITFGTFDGTTFTENVRFQNGGNVGINDTTPDATLDVEKASAVVAQFDRLTDDGTIINLAQAGVVEGTISVSGTTVSYNAFTGSHYAWTNETIEKGMLVTMTGDNHKLHDNPSSEILYGVKKTTSPNDPRVLGAYLSLLEPNQPPDNNNPHLIMSVGNGDMWVVEENEENLQVGDYLISSGVEGHAMKNTGQYQPAYIIARVAEPVDWDTVTHSINDNGTPKKHKRISVLFESYKEANLANALSTSSGTFNVDALGNLNTQGNVTIAGNVAIGTTVPLYKLHVTDNTSATYSALLENSNDTIANVLMLKMGKSTPTTTDSWIGFYNSDGFVQGKIRGDGSGNSIVYDANGGDYAEYYRKADPNEVIDYGDAVCLSRQGGVTKCSGQNNSLLGVMSYTAGFVGNGGHDGDPNYILVGIVGQLEVKVASDSEFINPSDPLTLSSTYPGKATKAIRAGPIIGRALASYDPTKNTEPPTSVSREGSRKVMMNIANTWYDPQVYLGMDGSLSYPVNSESAAMALGLPSVPETPTINNLQLTINSASDAASPSASFDLASDANFIDLKNRVITLESQIEDLRAQIINSSTQSAFLSSIASEPAVLGASDSADFVNNLSNLDIASATISGNLMVLGRTTTADLGVTGNIAVGLMSIHGLDSSVNNGNPSTGSTGSPQGGSGQVAAATINSVGDLYLQNNGLGGINILSGEVTIDTKGNIKTAGEIIAKKVNIDTTASDAASLGSGSLLAGDSLIEIPTTAVTNKSKIFVTATTKTGGQELAVTQKSSGVGFTVEIETPYIKDIRFDWFIIDEK